MTVLVVALLLGLLSLPVLVCATYLFILTIFSWPRQSTQARDANIHFDFIVPAHNEERGIGNTVRSLLAVDYPEVLRRVLVIADNCVDATAERAKEAGALVLVRTDETLRGKGHALKFAFDRVLSEGIANVAVVVDADTVVSPNLLRAFASRIGAGAQAVQADYGVRNPEASWRTRLMVIALSMVHRLRMLGRSRLGLSCGLRGNGMGFTRSALAEVPYGAFSIVEDVEYGVQLARAGYVVEYVPEAHVLGEMVSSERSSRSQRQRWESGRAALKKLYGWPLMKSALARGDRVLLDMAFDVVVPPLASIWGASCVGLVGSMILAAARGPRYLVVAAPWVVAVGMLMTYVLRGVWLSEMGMRGLLALAWAPVYMAWKLVLSLSRLVRPRSEEWIRTAREDEKPQ